MQPSLSIETVLTIVSAIVLATVWIVRSINGVEKAVTRLGVTLQADIDDHQRQIDTLAENVDELCEDLSNLKDSVEAIDYAKFHPDKLNRREN